MQVNIVIFWFMNDWGKYGRAYEKITENLANVPEVGRIFCLLPPVWLWEGYCPLPFVFKRVSNKLTVLTPNSHVVPDIMKPASFRNWINGDMRDAFIRYFLRFHTLKRDNTILWIFPPHDYIHSLVRFIPHRLLIAQYVDNNIFKPHQSEEKTAFTEKQYRDFARKADMVITSSNMNQEFFSSLNSNCYLFENAVDPIFISSHAGSPSVKKGKRPRIGYAGWITYRTDIELLQAIATSRPGYDLVLAGPIEEGLQIDEILGLPNVEYHGILPYRDVPEYLNALDVCLIPHKDSQYSRSMSPLKLFQYLGSGKPIVTTDVAGAKRWDHCIHIAGSHEEFIAQIDEALRGDSQEKRRKRIEAAKGETWEERIREMFGAVLTHYDKQGS